MYTTKERIAIARIVSDMIKADNIIEEAEIEMLNKFKNDYNIDSRILNEAQHIMFSQAVSNLISLKDQKKIEIFKTIKDISMSDGACVQREALLLLALKYVWGIERDPQNPKNYIINNKRNAQIISCPTGDTSISSQYIIYIEGKYNETENQNIQKNFELNVLSLRQWGFDFIYIPSLIENFRMMNAEYVKDVIGYMAPELTKETISVVYERLLRMDTVTFCNYVLAEKLNVNEVKNSEPSLFINIGTSVVPYCNVSGPVECYTEFLCIPLDNNITLQIKEFLKAYKKLVSYLSVSNQSLQCDETARFKYFGFYKAMFDFLVKAEPKASDIVMHPYNNLFEFPQITIEDLVLSPQEAALYKLILECTYNHPLGGLPTYYTEYQTQVDKLYSKIYHKNKAVLPDNLAPIRSRIESKMRKHLDGLANIEDFIPKMKNGKYIISAKHERIKIRNSHYDNISCFKGYTW